MPRHAARDRMDAESDFAAQRLQFICKLLDRKLRLCQRQAVTGDNRYPLRGAQTFLPFLALGARLKPPWKGWSLTATVVLPSRICHKLRFMARHINLSQNQARGAHYSTYRHNSRLARGKPATAPATPDKNLKGKCEWALSAPPTLL